MIREIAELTEFKAQNTKNMEMPDSDGDHVVYELKDGYIIYSFPEPDVLYFNDSVKEDQVRTMATLPTSMLTPEQQKFLDENVRKVQGVSEKRMDKCLYGYFIDLHLAVIPVFRDLTRAALQENIDLLCFDADAKIASQT